MRSRWPDASPAKRASSAARRAGERSPRPFRSRGNRTAWSSRYWLMAESAISRRLCGSDDMAVTVRLPGVLRDAVGGEARIEASGATLADVFADIDRRHPGFRS